MKKYFYKYILGLALLGCTLSLTAQRNFHSFIVEDINGEEFDLSQFKGKKVLVVNTASKCGLTPQYNGLQELYSEYKEKDFMIIGFPSNDFAGQEPGTNEEIATFCSTNFNVTFPMMSKIKVKGEDIHPLYKWLTSVTENGLEDSKVTWNFQKYMIDEEGNLVGHLPPRKKPTTKEIVSWIKSS